MPRLISRTPPFEVASLNLSEFKLWAKIDNDIEDGLLLGLLAVSAQSFETISGQFLNECEFVYELKDEMFLSPMAHEIKVDDGISVSTKNGVSRFEGNGIISFKAGFKEMPADVKLWLFNTALDLYENRSNHNPKHGLISTYVLKEF